MSTSRVSMLLAVLSKTGVSLGNQDVYTASVGGARLHEPAVDLAVALAVISAAGGSPGEGEGRGHGSEATPSPPSSNPYDDQSVP